MMQKMKITLVTELTQMDHLQNDQNQHLSNSFYEIKTATKLNEMLYTCNPNTSEAGVGGSKVGALIVLRVKTLLQIKDEDIGALLFPYCHMLGLAEDLCSSWGTHLFSGIGTSLSHRKLPVSNKEKYNKCLGMKSCFLIPKYSGTIHNG